MWAVFVNSAGNQKFLRFCTVGLSNFLISFVVYCLVYEYAVRLRAPNPDAQKVAAKR